MMNDAKKNQYFKQLVFINTSLRNLTAEGYELNKKKIRLIFDIQNSNNKGETQDKLNQELASTMEAIDKLVEKRKSLWAQKLLIDRDLLFLNPPDAQNDLIDLRLIHIGRYGIFLHGEKTLIGNIDYRGSKGITIEGDIKWSIFPKYQEYNYAYEALCLLGEILNKKGIDEFIVTTEVDNLASRKIIERYGGQLLEHEVNSILFYRCSTMQIKRERN